MSFLYGSEKVLSRRKSAPQMPKTNSDGKSSKTAVEDRNECNFQKKSYTNMAISPLPVGIFFVFFTVLRPISRICATIQRCASALCSNPLLKVQCVSASHMRPLVTESHQRYRGTLTYARAVGENLTRHSRRKLCDVFGVRKKHMISPQMSDISLCYSARIRECAALSLM